MQVFRFLIFFCLPAFLFNPLPAFTYEVYVFKGQAGKELDRGDLTKAGRALAKHGGRPDSVFPEPMGNPEQINNQDQEILEGILNHPESGVKYVSHPEFGDVIKVEMPGEGGVWFKVDGEMIGFLEP